MKYANEHIEPLGFDRFVLNGEPFTVNLQLDRRDFSQSFDVDWMRDQITDSIIYRFKTWLASRTIKGNKLNATVAKDIIVGYRNTPKSRFQNFKALLFPNFALGKFPVVYKREEIKEPRIMDFKVEFDAKIFYQAIMIPGRENPFVEITYTKDQ